ncbi:hypothetical protein OQA88_13352 [Cercophora sp. LCS_1]
MPTVNFPPGSNISPEPPTPSSHCQAGVFGAHIYLALAAAALFGAIRLATRLFGPASQAPDWATQGSFQDVKGWSGPESRKDSAAAYNTRHSAVHSPWDTRDQWGTSLDRGRKPQHDVCAARHAPLGVGAAREPQLAGRSQAMDGTDDGREKDHSSDSERRTSRGVSTSSTSAASPRLEQNPPLSGMRAGSPSEIRPGHRSPHSPPHVSFSSRDGRSPDGNGVKRFKGKGPMTGGSSWAGRSQSPVVGGEVACSQLDNTPGHGAGSIGVGYSTHQHFSPPPPFPSIPPGPSDAAYPFQNRRPSYAVSIPPELETSFIHQPNPDYSGGTTSADVPSSSPKSATSISRRRSYTRSVPIQIPTPTTTSASSSTETITSTDTFSPSSYPPTSPLLPPPPPGQDFPYEYEFVGGPGGPGVLLSEQEIDLHGEIISVMDDHGHGWKRHTRVYGGGVCLACAAAGEEGGFYGDKVPLEDRR